jgi:thiol-disulfide isomerase/thioredoxin
MLKKIMLPVIGAIASLCACAQGSGPQNTAAISADIINLKKAVEKDFTNAEAHKSYINAVGVTSQALALQYDRWISNNPSSTDIPMAYAEALYRKEMPGAKTYLMQVVKINPKYAKAWYMLSGDAERWFDLEASRGYLQKATDCEPANPLYAFAYASSYAESDPGQYQRLMLDMARRFPQHEKGAQALYWLANRVSDSADKVRIWELTKKSYDPARFQWSLEAMDNYFDFLLTRDITKARLLIGEILANDSLANDADWSRKKNITGTILEARALTARGKYNEALDTYNSIPILRYGASRQLVVKEKAIVNDLSGNPGASYDSLLIRYAKNPEDDLYSLMKSIGAKIGKNTQAIQADVWSKRQSGAQPATQFSLDNYLSPGKTSLTDLKGKVVLITYWFPGCGPCRAEFPYFESVVNKFSRDKLAYVGINMAPEQDAYVETFMKNTKYSFIPVRDEETKRGNLKAIGAPTNYLLDKNGNIVFSNFRIDESNQRTLELMISELLDK